MSKGKVKVPLFRPSFSGKDVDAIADVLYSGHLTTGPRCFEFETMFAERIGVTNAISTNSGSAALHLALAAIGVGPGDIVFVPTLAFAADIQVVQWQGAKPILVDCERSSLCIDPVKLRRTIEKIEEQKNTRGSKKMYGAFRAVIAVDYGGQMADYSALGKICKDWNMILIEDAAHALPAAWRSGPNASWQQAGTVADIACFSFYANKPITTGEGGMVVTNNDHWANRIRSMRLHGLEPMSSHPSQTTWNRQVTQLGFKYNLSDIAAAIGIRQLSQLHKFWQGRKEIAEKYTEHLSHCPSLKLPAELPNRQHAWHLYVVRLQGNLANGKRDAIIQQLYERGVQTSVHWYPLHRHQYYQTQIDSISDFDAADEIYPSIISLPIFPSMTDKELEFVTSCLLNVIEYLYPKSSADKL